MSAGLCDFTHFATTLLVVYSLSSMAPQVILHIF